jgi:putative transposase
MRVAEPIVLNPESRRQLELQARGRTVPVRVSLRSRIVLLAAEGKQHKQISEELKISPRMAALWRGRFLPRGVEGC